MFRPNVADDRAWVLDQKQDLFELRPGISPCAAACRRNRIEFRNDLGAALDVIGNDPDLTQRLAVAIGRRYRHGPTEEAVPLSDIAGADAVKLKRNRLIAELGHEPAHRAGEAQSCSVAPAHVL
jgi:hypothetical protein